MNTTTTKFFVNLTLIITLTACSNNRAFAEDKPVKTISEPSVYDMLDDHIQKLEKVSLEYMTIEVSLTDQEIIVHNGEPNGEITAICAFPCSTGPGKFEMVPSNMKTVLYETGPGLEGNRVSNQFGGVMRHCIRLRMKNKNGSEAYVAIHSANGEYVPRLPTTHGCIRIPNRAAKALFQKIWDGKPGKTKGGVKREIPVIFTGTTPVLDFGG